MFLSIQPAQTSLKAFLLHPILELDEFQICNLIFHGIIRYYLVLSGMLQKTSDSGLERYENESIL